MTGEPSTSYLSKSSMSTVSSVPRGREERASDEVRGERVGGGRRAGAVRGGKELTEWRTSMRSQGGRTTSTPNPVSHQKQCLSDTPRGQLTSRTDVSTKALEPTAGLAMEEGNLVRSSCAGSSARPQMEVVDPRGLGEQRQVASVDINRAGQSRACQKCTAAGTNQSLSTRLDAIQKELQVVRLALAYKELELP